MKKAIVTYSDLQSHIDILIGQIGLVRTIAIMSRIAQVGKTPVAHSNREKLIRVFVISKAISVFELEEDAFYTDTSREYREARMCCYHLIYTYTDSSYARIARNFKKSKRAIIYHCQKCTELLSIKQYYKDFFNRYEILQEQLMDFIAKLEP